MGLIHYQSFADSTYHRIVLASGLSALNHLPFRVRLLGDPVRPILLANSHSFAICLYQTLCCLHDFSESYPFLCEMTLPEKSFVYATRLVTDIATITKVILVVTLASPIGREYPVSIRKVVFAGDEQYENAGDVKRKIMTEATVITVIVNHTASHPDTSPS